MSINYLLSIWNASHDELKLKSNFRNIFPNYESKSNNNINFSSNDYLCLRKDKRIAEAGYIACQKNGSGTGASRIVVETDEGIQYLENFFCDHTKFKYAMFFPSGFLANISFFDVLSPFLSENIAQEIFIDHRCHASLFFGLKNAEIKYSIFRHQDYEHLEKKLASSEAKAKIIVIESLYSMDGDFSDPEQLATICEKYQASIFIDEGHTFGIYGNKGTGWINNYPALKKYIIAAMFGCGKAVGVSGAFLATNYLEFKERIIQKSKAFIFSTGISPFVTGAVLKSLEIIFSPEGDNKRKSLIENINFFKENFSQIDCDKNYKLLENTFSQIIPIIIGDSSKAVELSKFLIDNAIIVKAIRPPSVPNRTSRLRVTLNSNHTKENIGKIIYYINKFLNQK